MQLRQTREQETNASAHGVAGMVTMVMAKYSTGNPK